MDRKKVLIITYYWPPSGGSGVQRWVKFVKYLREFNWEPIIYTPENPEFPIIDYSFESDLPSNIEVIKLPIWEPYSIYKRFIGLKNSDRISNGVIQNKKSDSIQKKISLWIRGNLFIPDARKFWIKPSINFLSSYISNNQVNAIVTNGTPHSLHLIGLELKKNTDVPWLADFRDPWTNIDFFDELNLTSWASNKHHDLEKKVLREADAVTVTAPSTAIDFGKLTPTKIHTITNGFDESDFKNVATQRDEKFVMAHIGMFTASRNHPFFWKLLKEIIDENLEFKKDFRLRLIGNIDSSVLLEIEKNGLNSNLETKNYLPHSEVIDEQLKAWCLLLVIWEAKNATSMLPGKVFEYMASERPIICIGPKKSDVSDLLSKTETGTVFSNQDRESLKKEILYQYSNFKHKKKLLTSKKHIQTYSRRNLTYRMSQILNSIIE